MKPHSKLTQREDTRHDAEQHTASVETREFASVEALLRHDAAQTSVPLALARKVQEAAARVPTPKRAWWRQLFGL